MRENDKHYKRGDHPSRRAPEAPPVRNEESDPAYLWGEELGEATAKEVVDLIKEEETKMGRSMTKEEREAFLKQHGGQLIKNKLIRGIAELFEPKSD